MTLLEERVSRVNGKPNLCRLVVEVCLIAVRPYELLLAAQAIVDGASVVGKHAVVTVHEQRRNIHVSRGGDAVEEQPVGPGHGRHLVCPGRHGSASRVAVVVHLNEHRRSRIAGSVGWDRVDGSRADEPVHGFFRGP